eukprot:comp18112_c0_seq1/m.18776 comp18112_c0_seq1/g.18776  ORF comp18112_c0_seq1/g.18776 comp18112_c0_seq1/m.18776 type:complete len:500 (-) comp18112_c0_seq1:65-1564(-)
MSSISEDQKALAKKLGTFEITFEGDREVYYENDTILGTVICTELKERTPVSKLRAVVVCDVTYKDSLGLLWTDRIYREHVDIKTDTDFLEVGVSKKFDFKIPVPTDLPPTLAVQYPEAKGSSHRGVTWSLRIVSEDADGSAKVLTAREFFKGAVYEKCLAPKGEATRRDLTNNTKELVVEAELGKNVYVHGEPVDVHVRVRNDTSSQVKSITCKIYQKVSFDIPQKETHQIRKQRVAFVENDEGCPLAKGELSRDFTLTPEVDPANKLLCLRAVAEGADASTPRVLAPSATYYDTRTERPESMKIHFSIVYTVKVSLRLGLGRKLSVSLPFTLSDSTANIGEILPRAHRMPSYHVKASKSFLRLSKAKVEAVPEYGREEALLEEERRRKLEEEIAANQGGLKAIVGKAASLVSQPGSKETVSKPTAPATIEEEATTSTNNQLSTTRLIALNDTTDKASLSLNRTGTASARSSFVSADFHDAQEYQSDDERLVGSEVGGE